MIYESAEFSRFPIRETSLRRYLICRTALVSKTGPKSANKNFADLRSYTFSRINSNNFVGFVLHTCILNIKGSVQRKLRPRLLYIIQKLFSWRWAAENKIFTFLKGQFAIYIKPLQRIYPSPITFAGKCYSPSANCVCGQ